MAMQYDYADYGVLVTGAGRGIGYGICESFAVAGARVALNDVDPDAAQGAAAAINMALNAQRVSAHPFDIADSAAVQRAVAAVASAWGRLDVAVCNAGITNFGRFLDYSPAAFDRVMAVNLRGTYFTAQAAAKAMIEQGVRGGRILLMASVTGVVAYPNLSAYGMTKAAIIHLAKVLAAELGEHHITVNAICPGATLTERTLKDDPHYEAHWAAVASDGRVGYVEDIAQTALFLASPQARHISGQTLVVDGGWTTLSPIPDGTPDLPEESSKLT